MVAFMVKLRPSLVCDLVSFFGYVKATVSELFQPLLIIVVSNRVFAFVEPDYFCLLSLTLGSCILFFEATGMVQAYLDACDKAYVSGNVAALCTVFFIYVNSFYPCSRALPHVGLTSVILGFLVYVLFWTLWIKPALWKTFSEYVGVTVEEGFLFLVCYVCTAHPLLKMFLLCADVMDVITVLILGTAFWVLRLNPSLWEAYLNKVELTEKWGLAYFYTLFLMICSFFCLGYFMSITGIPLFTLGLYVFLFFFFVAFF